MRINHIAAYVSDLEAMKLFYIKYFGAVSNRQYHNETTGLKTYFLTFEDGARFEIMTRPDMAEQEKSVMRTGYIHLAFSVGSRQNVDELTEHLKRDGFEVISGPRLTGDGYYESCVLDPEHNMIEIVE